MIITIITPSYNNAATIADCLKSVVQQSYPCEHILIDGASEDETVQLAKALSPRSTIISEPDNGIYDAMNKGVAHATGDIIGILNADDFYAHHEVLQRVARIFDDGSVDCCYGDLVYVRESDTSQVVRYWRSGDYWPERFYRGWMPPHPTFFVRRALYQKFGNFNQALGTSADYELMLRFLLRHNATAAYIPEVLVKMRTGGQSNASLLNRLRANRMDRLAWRINGITPHPWTLFLKPLSKICQYSVGRTPQEA